MWTAARKALALAGACVVIACAQAPGDASPLPGTIGLVVRQAPAGLEVSALRPGGPAERAGIRVGDRVVSCNGKALSSVGEFRRLVLDSAPGSALTLTVARGGDTRDVRVPVEQLDLSPGV